jgi:hypothetical protein
VKMVMNPQILWQQKIEWWVALWFIFRLPWVQISAWKSTRMTAVLMVFLISSRKILIQYLVLVYDYFFSILSDMSFNNNSTIQDKNQIESPYMKPIIN